MKYEEIHIWEPDGMVVRYRKGENGVTDIGVDGEAITITTDTMTVLYNNMPFKAFSALLTKPGKPQADDKKK